MRHSAPLRLRHGPVQIYLKPFDGCLDLERFVWSLPPETQLMWLDSARPHEVTGRWSMVGYDPWLTLVARGDHLSLRTAAASQSWRAHPLEALREILRRYRAPASLGGVGRAVGLMGYLSYDLNRWIERLPAPATASGGPGPQPQPDALRQPDMVWFGMRVVALVDHVEARSWLVAVVDPHLPPPLARREALEALHRAEQRVRKPLPMEPMPPRSRVGSLQATSTQQAFERMVSRALEYIRDGEIFQANIAQRLMAAYEGSARTLYQALRRINPSPFACWLSSNEATVVSCSPERLVRAQEGRVDARPIAGTRPRGRSPQEDAVNSLELLLSEKERAEHLMLVDLARNDLGRVCAVGSVAVNELMTLEEYSHVIHIVSDISGRPRPGVDAVDVIRAVFPGGTITGCPKVRCMQILSELEPVARGLYTGSLGYLAFDGTLDLNIAIRTMILQGSRLSFHVGAGIVADSDPEREYHETLDKAAALVSALRAVAGPVEDALLR